MMLKPSNIAAMAIFAAITANTVYAEDKIATTDSNTVITVNNITIPQTRIDLSINAQIQRAAQQGQQLQRDNPELLKAVSEELINLEVISQAAIKNKIDQRPDVAQQIAMTIQNILASAYVQDYVKTNPISDETYKQAFEAWKLHQGNKEYKVAHILVESEKDAVAVIAELNKKGSKFDKIAKEKSKDPGSKDRGGELGWMVPSNFVQPFGEAILKLSKGKTSAPVQTQFGWHVIKLEDERVWKAPSFEEIKPKLEKPLTQQAIQEAIKKLRADAVIKP